MWLSISSTVGNVPLKSAGKSFANSYSEIPIGSFMASKAYLANTLSFVLHMRMPIVGLSVSARNS